MFNNYFSPHFAKRTKLNKQKLCHFEVKVRIPLDT